MQTLTEDQFKKKYGVVAASQFDDAQKQTSLFGDIKNSISQRADQNNQILSQPAPDVLGQVAQGTQLAANTAGGAIDIAGNVLNRIPGVGPALNAAGGAIKKGFNAVTDKLAGTKFFQEAAGGLPENSNLEKGLKIASAGGEIAGDIAGADLGVSGAEGALNKAGNVATRVSEKIDSLPKPSLPDLGGATAYLKGAIKDVSPTMDRTINHQVAKALDLTPSDLNNIYQSTGNDVGRWMADNNLIGVNPESTQALIKNFFTTNYQGVRAAIAQVTKEYTRPQVPGYYDALQQVYNKVQGVAGLEKEAAQVQNLMNKERLTLSDVQAAKELLDDHFSLYKVTGDVSQGVAKQGLANIRSQLKTFIEKEVKANVKDEAGNPLDIRKMNQDVSTAKSIGDAIVTRSQRGLTRANITWRDVMVGMGLYAFVNPLVGIAAVFARKLVTSPTFRLRVARFLDQLSDAKKAKINAALQEGKLPPELEALTNQTSTPTP